MLHIELFCTKYQYNLTDILYTYPSCQYLLLYITHCWLRFLFRVFDLDTRLAQTVQKYQQKYKSINRSTKVSTEVQKYQQ